MAIPAAVSTGGHSLEHVGQREAVEEVHDDDRTVAGSWQVVDHSHDVLALHAGEQNCLAREAHHHLVTGEGLLAQHLDGHTCPELHVGALPHLAHRAGSDSPRRTVTTRHQ